MGSLSAFGRKRSHFLLAAAVSFGLREAAAAIVLTVKPIFLRKGDGALPRDYTIRLNKKEKRAALKSALTSRVQENKFIVVEELKFNEIKTKNFKNVLNNLKVNKALVVLSESDENAVLSARNIADVKTAQAGTINVYDILKYNTVVASKAAVASIEEKFWWAKVKHRIICLYLQVLQQSWRLLWEFL